MSSTVSWSLLKFMYIQSMMPSNQLILCRPLLLPSLFPSIRVFSNEFALCIRWAKYWSFSFSISPSNECSGLISFRIDWFDFLAVQGTFKKLFQHNLKASILQSSAFFMTQLSHLYMTLGEAIALTVWTFDSMVEFCWCRRLGFDPWIRKIPWRRKPNPVFLSGKSHGQRSLVGYSPWGHKASDVTEHVRIKSRE